MVAATASSTYADPVISIVPRNVDAQWLEYFDPRQAIASVMAHIKSLPSARTEERHTERVYTAGLQFFLEWCFRQTDMGSRLQSDIDWHRPEHRDLVLSSMPLPTADLIQMFIGVLKTMPGSKPGQTMKSNTIGSKYLAPVRLYLQRLANQQVTVYGEERWLVVECREHIRQAAAVKTPRADETSNIAPLWRYGNRLTLKQVRATLRAIDTTTIKGARDYALLRLGFESALRLAELQRLTLSSFSREGDCWLIRVRGKRNNVDPVAISDACYQAILRYVEMYNAPLDKPLWSLLPAGNDDYNDPRMIGPNTPLWQPVIHGDHHAKLGANGYDPSRGLGHQGLRYIISHRTEQGCGVKCSPHDLRRTYASLAFKNGMDITSISQNMRHADSAMTLHYIGREPNHESSLLIHHVKLD